MFKMWWLIFLVLIRTYAALAKGKHHCRSSNWNQTAELCLGGCQPGYGGSKCDEAHFSKNCNSSGCKMCQQGWDGPNCTRENIARKLLKKLSDLKDKNLTTCAVQNRTKLKIEPIEQKYVLLELYSEFANETACSVKFKKDLKCVLIPDKNINHNSQLFHCEQKQRNVNQTVIVVECPSKLCEVKIYACKDFWWGPEDKCSNFCNCWNGTKCNPLTGHCGSCPYGYQQTDNCAFECNPGTYGQNCSGICSCTDVNICNKVTGVCQHAKFGKSTEPVSIYSSGIYNITSTAKLDESHHRSEISHPDKSKSSGDYLTILLSVFGAMVLLSFSVGCLVSYHRRKLTKNKKRAKSDQASEENDMSSNLLVLKDNIPQDESSGCYIREASLISDVHLLKIVEENIYANAADTFTPTTIPVPVASLRQHISRMNIIGGYKLEFELLPAGLSKSIEAALAANKEGKNRYKLIYPYDNNRVILPMDEIRKSDYVNASYIDGFNESRMYIAAQGPLPNTVEDFWHMVWTEGCGKIVMLNNQVEAGKVKSEQYWPELEGETRSYGSYTISCLKVTSQAHFVIRKLSVSKKLDEEGHSSTHHVQHFHFTAWFDHGIPSAPALAHFWTLVKHSPACTGPMLVHCSAGVGRTGTFIGMDILIQEAEAKATLSTFLTVYHLRQQRAFMVQNLSQYIFLHEVVAEILDSLHSQIFAHELQLGNNWVSGNDGIQLSDTVMNKLNEQFKKLCNLRPVKKKDQVKAGLLPENFLKNRSPEILPLDDHRVCLWMPCESDSDYISAVFLPSLTSQHGFIVTQLPLQQTAADFWRMVFDWRSEVVVRFLDGTIDEQLESLLSPQQGQQLQLGSVTVLNEKTIKWEERVHRHTLQLQRQEVQECWQKVTLFTVDMASTLQLSDTKTFLNLANFLQPNSMKQSFAIVQCFDGAGLSCLFCALVIALGMLETEGSVSLYLLVRLLQCVQSQAFSTFDHYRFLFHCLEEYATQESNTTCEEMTPNGTDRKDGGNNDVVSSCNNGRPFVDDESTYANM